MSIEWKQMLNGCTFIDGYIVLMDVHVMDILLMDTYFSFDWIHLL